MRMQPYYFWMCNLVSLSLLVSCSQPQSSTTDVASVTPKDTDSQPQQNLLELPAFGMTSSPPPTMGTQPSQNGQLLPNQQSLVNPSPSSNISPNQQPQSLVNPSLPSKGTQLPQSGQIFPTFQTLTAEKSSPTIPLSSFLPDRQGNRQTVKQKPAQLIVQSLEPVQSSQLNPVPQKESPAQSLLNSLNNQISLAQPNLPTPPLRLSLKEAFEKADTKNPQLLAAQHNIRISAAGITIAGAIPNPQIGVEYGFGSVYSQGGNPQQLSLNQTIEMGGKRSKRISVAKTQYQLAILQYNSTRFDIHGQVRRAYAELAAAQASDLSQKEQVELLKKLVYISQKRFEAGVAPEAELLQAKLLLNQTEPILGQSQGRIEQARIQLNALMGDSPTQNIQIIDPGIFNVAVKNTEIAPLANAPIPSIDNLLAQAYQQRLDFKSAQEQTNLAKEQLRLAKSMRVPDLEFSAGYQFTTANAPTPNTDGEFLGLAINLPLFYNQQGEITQAKVTIDQSVQQENVVRSQIAVDVRSAYDELKVARETIHKYQSRLLFDSREVLALAQESYQVGKTNLASVITAEQSDQQNRSAYVDAVTAYQSAYADLEKAVGIPLSF